MYRKDSGKMGFSCNRFITNAVPNFASDNPEQDATLTANEQDILWIHQVQGAEAARREPMTLDEGSFLKAGITPSEKNSAGIYKELLKNKVINPATPLGIDTTQIGPKFTHNLAFVSVHAQRKVIGMLFFWEEECQRWRLLEQERAEIEKAERTEQDERMKEELGVRLEGVKMRMGVRPSQRGQEDGGGIQDQGPVNDGPPRYE